MLKLCTAVMRHDPSFKMSPAGLVSDLLDPECTSGILTSENKY